MTGRRKSSSDPLGGMFWLRVASLVAALLSLAAKENGIACLPIAATWDLIRLGHLQNPNNVQQPLQPR